MANQGLSEGIVRYFMGYFMDYFMDHVVRACSPRILHYSKYNPSVLLHPLAGRLHGQLANTALYLKSQGGFFPEVEGKLAVSAVSSLWKKKV